jgi:hypothetical protein
MYGGPRIKHLDDVPAEEMLREQKGVRVIFRCPTSALQRAVGLPRF